MVQNKNTPTTFFKILFKQIRIAIGGTDEQVLKYLAGPMHRSRTPPHPTEPPGYIFFAHPGSPPPPAPTMGEPGILPANGGAIAPVNGDAILHTEEEAEHREEEEEAPAPMGEPSIQPEEEAATMDLRKEESEIELRAMLLYTQTMDLEEEEAGILPANGGAIAPANGGAIAPANGDAITAPAVTMDLEEEEQEQEPEHN